MVSSETLVVERTSVALRVPARPGRSTDKLLESLQSSGQLFVLLGYRAIPSLELVDVFSCLSQYCALANLLIINVCRR